MEGPLRRLAYHNVYMEDLLPTVKYRLDSRFRILNCLILLLIFQQLNHEGPCHQDLHPAVTPTLVSCRLDGPKSILKKRRLANSLTSTLFSE